MKRRYLVTGGAGFIGSHLVDRLVGGAEHVTVLDDLSSGSVANLQHHLDQPTFRFVQGSVTDAQLVSALASECDVICHLAALVSVPTSIQDPAASFRTNVLGTFNVFEAARQATVRSVIFASSAAVYGHAGTLPVQEGAPPCPLSPYAADKLYGESLAKVYAETYGLASWGFRFFNVYGPRQNPSSPYSGVISIFMDRIRAGQPVTICGDGEQTRDFIHVSDVVNAIEAASKHVRTGSSAFANVLNLGGGERCSINALHGLLREILRSDMEAIYAPPRVGEVRHSQASIAKAKDLLGWQPQTALRAGLEDLAESRERYAEPASAVA